MEISIYTDGSCPVPHGPGAWAFIVLDKVNTYESGFCRAQQTNNTMELIAVLKALRFVKSSNLREASIRIYTDSMYVINGMISQWRHVEAQTDFRGVKNGLLWKRLHTHAERCRSLRFSHVKGHDGDTWNEWADRMAAKALREGKLKLETNGE